MSFKFNPITNRLDLTGTSGGGGGDVSGPGSSTNNAIVRWSGTTGTLIKDSTATLSDTGDIVANSIDLTIPVAVVDGGTGLSTTVTGDILYADASNSFARLPIGSNSEVLTVSGGLPIWASAAGGGVTSVSGTANRITSSGGATPIIDIAATYVGQTSITTLGTITTGVWNGSTITTSRGGTGNSGTPTDGQILVGRSSDGTYIRTLPTNGNNITWIGGSGTLRADLTGTTNHAIQLGNASGNLTSLSLGSAGQVLQSGGASADPAFSTATYPSIATGTGTILRADGTNWVASSATYPNTVTSGDMLYASASNVLSNLATVNNSALTTNSSGVPTWVTPPTLSTGNLAWFNGQPDVQTTARYAQIYDDFLGGLGVQSVTANAGTGGYVQPNLGTNNAGFYQIRSGVNTNGFSSLLLSGSNQNSYYLSTGLVYFETMLRGDQIGSAGDQLNLYFGLHNCTSSGVTNGIYFSYVYATDTTHWIINANNGGTATSTVTSVVADPSTFTKLAFLYNSTGPTCTFYINGSSVGTITTNFPTSAIGANWAIQKVSGTTNVGWFIDYLNWVIQFTNSR